MQSTTDIFLCFAHYYSSDSSHYFSFIVRLSAQFGSLYLADFSFSASLCKERIHINLQFPVPSFVGPSGCQPSFFELTVPHDFCSDMSHGTTNSIES